MPVRLHHIVIDAHDLPGLARFWTQALGWKILSERGNEVVIGTDENAPVGICFMPVTDPKTVKNRVHVDLTTSAADRDREIGRLLALGARRCSAGMSGPGPGFTVRGGGRETVCEEAGGQAAPDQAVSGPEIRCARPPMSCWWEAGTGCGSG